jgi:3-hydroxybutyryl-CoA dehydrogenase
MLSYLHTRAEKVKHLGEVAIIGSDSLTYSIAECLLKAGYLVHLCTNDSKGVNRFMQEHFSEIKNWEGKLFYKELNLILHNNFEQINKIKLVIVATKEDLLIKRDTIHRLEMVLEPDAIICINSESIGLNEIQQGSSHGNRILGLNWAEPVPTTRFLEIIINSVVSKTVHSEINKFAAKLNKDFYTVENFGVRSRLMSAMAREAFYLVENGYASVEDIDRACRNDAGYYLPFAGNCRYMDLMGTYAYGMVMKDLNPNLSKEEELPDFFKVIIKEGAMGMENGKGFYQYTEEEVRAWKNTFNEFSGKIAEIINKYPFNYKKDIA